jgi:hypothetical protein
MAVAREAELEGECGEIVAVVGEPFERGPQVGFFERVTSSL